MHSTGMEMEIGYKLTAPLQTGQSVGLQRSSLGCSCAGKCTAPGREEHTFYAHRDPESTAVHLEIERQPDLIIIMCSWELQASIPELALTCQRTDLSTASINEIKKKLFAIQLTANACTSSYAYFSVAAHFVHLLLHMPIEDAQRIPPLH